MKYKMIITATFILAVVLFMSCKKNSYFVTERISSDGSAQIKIGYFSAYTVLPSTILYINDKPVSNALVGPIGFPGGGFNTLGSSNGDYLWVTPGSAKIQGFTPVPATGNLMTNYSSSPTISRSISSILFMLPIRQPTLRDLLYRMTGLHPTVVLHASNS
jgi:hypothetical protein